MSPFYADLWASGPIHFLYVLRSMGILEVLDRPPRHRNPTPPLPVRRDGPRPAVTPSDRSPECMVVVVHRWWNGLIVIGSVEYTGNLRFLSLGRNSIRTHIEASFFLRLAPRTIPLDGAAKFPGPWGPPCGRRDVDLE